MASWVLITGASSGIGEELVYEYDAKGYCTILVARREDKLRVIGKKLRNKYHILKKDLSKLSSVYEIEDFCKENKIEIEILINNAAMALIESFDKSDPKVNEQTMILDMINPIQLTRIFLPQMIQKNQGQIIQVSSIAGLLPGCAYMALYFASKQFLVSFSRSLSEELDGTGVSTSVICPGIIETKLIQDIFKNTFKSDDPSYIKIQKVLKSNSISSKKMAQIIVKKAQKAQLIVYSQLRLKAMICMIQYISSKWITKVMKKSFDSFMSKSKQS